LIRDRTQSRNITWLGCGFGSTESGDPEIEGNPMADRDIGEGDGNLNKKRQSPTYNSTARLLYSFKQAVQKRNMALFGYYSNNI
jgi:hypothetical protein